MKTTNYEMFKFHMKNREINIGLVKRLMDSIKKIGFVESRPVIIDKNNYIIDGQHRLEACKRLNVPVYYVVDKTLDFEDAVIYLNKSQEVWRLNEYLHFYTEKGLLPYIQISELYKKYPKAGVSCILVACYGLTNKGKPHNFRVGNIPEIEENSHKVMEFLYSCSSYVSHCYEKTFASAIKYIYDKLTDNDIDKLKKILYSLPKLATKEQYITAFENALNYRRRKELIRL